MQLPSQIPPSPPVANQLYSYLYPNSKSNNQSQSWPGNYTNLWSQNNNSWNTTYDLPDEDGMDECGDADITIYTDDENINSWLYQSNGTSLFLLVSST